MGMTRGVKETEVLELKKRIDTAEILVLTTNLGLDAKGISELRLKTRANDVGFKIVKNTLARLAVQGTRYEQIAGMFKGPVGMATSTDPVAAAKVISEFAKKNNRLEIIGGAYGDMILNEEAVKKLASLPSLDELRSKILGLIQAPATKVAGVLQAPARNMVGVTKAYSEKA